VACLGGEETYDIVVDANEIMSGPVGWALKVTGISGKYLKNGDHLPPIAKGLGWTGLPKPERLYIKLGHRISTAPFSEHAEDVAVQERLKAEVEDAFRVLFEELEAVRAKDSEEEPWRKMLKRW
jgi:hypothetical protein